MFDRGVLLITPFHKSQRGNSITTERIREGLISRGVPAQRLSLEEEGWPQRLKDLLKTGEEIIHGFNAHHMAALLENFPGLLRSPFIITVTGTDINAGMEKGRIPVQYALEKTDRLVVFHDDFKARLAELGGCLPAKVSVIPQGVVLPPGPPRNRKDFGIPDERVIFLLPTGLRPIKNIELALDGLEDLAREDGRVQLLIMGAVIDAPYGKGILERVEKLPWVKYLGEIPHSAIGGVMGLGDAVINCSLSEGQPQAALEAMSLGMPAILTDVPGNSNIISNGREGFYVRGPREFSRAARDLVNDPARRRQMGIAAGKLIRSRFNPDTEIDRHIEIYRLLSGKS